MSDELKSRVIAAIRTVQDPELPVNLYDLGLIYELDVVTGGGVNILMTLTTPNCPVAESMPGMVAAAVRGVDGVSDVKVQLTWDPPWSGDRMAEDARAVLDMMGIQWSESGPSGPKTTPLTVARKRPDPSG